MCYRLERRGRRAAGASECGTTKLTCFVGAVMFVLAAQTRTASGLTVYDMTTARGGTDRLGYFPNANIDPQDLTAGAFGLLTTFSLPPLGPAKIVGDIYATPLLYSPKADLLSQIIFVATEQNNVYTLNATTGTVIAKKHLTDAFDFSKDGFWCDDIVGFAGISGTPVIDSDTGTVYLWTKTYIPGKTGYENARYLFHALDVMTLSERPGYPVDQLQGRVAENASPEFPNPNSFFAGYQLQRTALLLMGDAVYAGFGSHCDSNNYTGWIVGVHKTEARVTSVWSTVVDNPNGAEFNGGGVWMAGSGLATDGSNRLFFVTGNDFLSPTTKPTPGDSPPASVLGMAVVNLGVNSTSLKTKATDFFMPYNYADLNAQDLDFASGGITLLPTSVFGTKETPKLSVVAGKTGILYLLDRDRLGGFLQGSDGGDAVVQAWLKVGGVNQMALSQPGVYPAEGGWVYLTTLGDRSLHAFKYSVKKDGKPSFAMFAASTTDFGRGVSSPVTTSMNGIPGSGLVWILEPTASSVYVFKAVPSNGSMTPIFTYDYSKIGDSKKFIAPTFTNGRAFIAAGSKVIVLGRKQTPLSAPLTNFATTAVGNTLTTTVTFRLDPSAAKLTISTASLAGSPSFSLAESPKLPKSMTQGSTIDVAIAFKPLASGPVGGSLKLYSNSGKTLVGAASLYGVGGTSAAGLSMPRLLDFGSVKVNANGAARTLTIKNMGNSASLVSSKTGGIIIPGPFARVGANGGVLAEPVEPGASVKEVIEFRPKKVGAFAVDVVFSTTGGNQTLRLTGKAV
ncbi:hypothetical protein DFJ73DRAFT_164619 [Zopfochytrium polystomum]|nr:hypothetical protein DFJ73DRAFT_164619 [Zopfochytrium polystomum]